MCSSVSSCSSRHLRQDVLGNAGLDEQVDALPGQRAEHQLVQLGLHALDGDAVNLSRHLAHRVEDAISNGEPELGDEPGGAQHA